MFECVDAVRFDRKMGIGRTKPVLLVCESPEGEVEVVAKFSQGCSVGGLIREALTAMFAIDLGLPVPPPYLVKLSEDFVDSIPDSAVAEFLRKGDSFGFGSRRLPDGYGAWIEPAGKMSNELEQQALNILSLDCWLTNGDRHVKNHNLLTNGKRFAIFDHELALMTDLNLRWQEPWRANALDGARPPQEHVFFGHLRGRASYELDPLSARLDALTDQRINEYLAALPPSWAAEVETCTKAVSFIMLLRDNLVPAGTELKRVLS
jgi:hypothetical protein